MNPKQLVAIGGAALLILGSFLEWGSVDTVFGSIGVNGMEGDGKLTLVAGGIALLLFAAVKHRNAAIVGSIFAGIGGAIALYDFGNISSKVSDVSEASNGLARASVGVGLYLCLVGAAVAVVAGIMWAVDLGKQPAASVRPVSTTGSPLPPPPPPPPPAM
jgi:hypothetical protein